MKERELRAAEKEKLYFSKKILPMPRGTVGGLCLGCPPDVQIGVK